jgi:hypothetical protein
MVQGLVGMEVERKSSWQVRQVQGEGSAILAVVVVVMVMVVSMRWEVDGAISKETCWCGVVGFRGSG